MDELYIYKKEFADIEDNQKQQSQFWIKPNTLELSALQYFAKRYMNPYNPQNNRLLLKVGTGVGKTLTSLQVAQLYIKLFIILNQKLQKSSYVIILGFSKSVFKREFMKFPELNIITHEEIHELNKLKSLIDKSIGNVKNDLTNSYKMLETKIKKRITNDKTGGLYLFYGYQELANKLFNSLLPADINATNIMQYYKEKKISINQYILERFNRSLIICDEIHQTYNSKEINNYGIAIQFLLEYYNKNIFALFLSATIINHNRRELIDIANLLRDQDVPPFSANDYFASDDLEKSAQDKINHNKLKPIYDQMKGKVIFLEETGINYPELRLQGTSVPDVLYLKFSTSKMCPLMEQTYKLDNLFEEKTKNFPIYDMVYPNPEFTYEEHFAFHPCAEAKKRNPKMKGLYNSEEIKTKIENAPQDWKNKIGIEVVQNKSHHYYTGKFLHMSNLPIYSSKSVKFMEIIMHEFKTKPKTKAIIIHKNIKPPGVLQIAEILGQNGFLNYFTEIPSPNTYSYDSMITNREWKKKYPDKEFKPARYFALHSDITSQRKDEIIDIWNSPQNRYGELIKYFIGAGKIKQSVDFKNTNNTIIFADTKDIAEYIQVKGRNVRNMAMIGLPPEMNYVNLYTLLDISSHGKSLEHRKYEKKVKEFKIIREIEYHINIDAVNNYIYYSEKGFEPIDVLGALPFKSNIKVDKKHPLDYTTFYGHEYYKDTLRSITIQIKRAFISVPVWTCDSLFEFLKDKNFNSGLNISSNRNIFNVALSTLIYNKKQFINNKTIDLFSINNIIINTSMINGVEVRTDNRVIIEYGKYLLLATINKKNNIIIDQDMFLKKHYNDNKIKFTIDTTNSNSVEKINYDKLQKENADDPNYNYNFLHKWKAEDHYNFMKNHIQKIAILPDRLVKMYKDLHIIGKNYYIADIYKHIYSDGEWKSDRINIPYRNEFEIVGIIESASFKLREYQDANITDARLKEKGYNCTSASKKKIKEIMKKLNIDIKNEKLILRNICFLIMRELINREIEVRNANGEIRYIYLFNETQ